MALIRKFAPVLLTVAGTVTLAVGVGLIFMPAGLVVGGAVAAGAGLFWDFEGAS